VTAICGENMMFLHHSSINAIDGTPVAQFAK
jgi:hypothetical protein